MATLRNLGISLLYLSGVPEITRTPRPSDVTETESSTTCRYEAQVSNDFGDPVDLGPFLLGSAACAS